MLITNYKLVSLIIILNLGIYGSFPVLGVENNRYNDESSQQLIDPSSFIKGDYGEDETEVDSFNKMAMAY